MQVRVVATTLVHVSVPRALVHEVVMSVTLSMVSLQPG
jgi:hypothetical protein